MTDARCDIAIIGGGITGLAAAHRLQRIGPSLSVTLLERSSRLGGKIVTERTGDGYVIEGAPDSFLSRKPRGLGLCEELGLSGSLVGRNPDHNRTFVMRHGELHPMPTGLTGLVPTDFNALAESSLISPAGRDRLMRESELPPLPANGDESVASFATRRLGAEVFEQLVEPLLAGIYAGDATRLSLAATFPQLRELELKHGSLIRGLQASRRTGPFNEGVPPFVSLPGGMTELVDAIRARIEGVDVRCGVGVSEIEGGGGAYRLNLSDGSALKAKALIVATPAHITARLLGRVDAELAELHAAIPHASTATVTLAWDERVLPRPLYGYGYVIPKAEQTDVLACTFTSSKWVGRAPDGKAAVRIYLGRHGGRDVLEDDDASLIAQSRAEVEARLGIKASPELTRVYRWPLGSPQYVLGHPERLEAIEALLRKHHGLFLAGASYRGVGIPDCIHSGEEVARQASHLWAG